MNDDRAWDEYVEEETHKRVMADVDERGPDEIHNPFLWEDHRRQVWEEVEEIRALAGRYE